MYRHDAQATSSATFAGVHKIRRWWGWGLGTETGWPHDGFSPSLDRNGNVFLTSHLKVWELTASSGGVVWASTITCAQDASNYGRWSQPALDDSGRVFISSMNAVVALDGATGAPLWSFDPRGLSFPSMLDVGNNTVASFESPSSPVIAPDGGIFVTSERGGGGGSGLYRVLVKLDSSGNVLWGRTNNNSLYPPVITTDGWSVFVKSYGGTLYANNGTTGATVWSAAMGNNSPHISLGHALIGSRIFAFTGSSPNLQLRCLDSDTGNEVWTATHTFSSNPFAPVVDDVNHRVYVISSGRILGYSIYNLSPPPNPADTVVDINLGIGSNHGPLTLAGSDTAYVVGYQNGKWRLFDIDLAGGSVRWAYDFAGIGTTSVGKPGVTVSSGAIMVHIGQDNGPHSIYYFASDDYANMAVSSATASTQGTTLWVTTVTVALADAGAQPNPNVPVIIDDFSSSGGGYSLPPIANQPPLTNLIGQTTYQILWDFASINVMDYENFSSTLTVSVPGMPSQQILLREDRPASLMVSTTVPSIEFDGSNIVRVTTITVTVRDAGAGPVQGIPVRLMAQDYPGSISPDNAVFTDAAGQARFEERIGAGAISDGNWEGFQSRGTVYVLGQPPQPYDTREIRIASFTVAWSSPTIQPDVGFATMTVTAWDAAWSTVPYTMVRLLDIPTYSVFWFKGTNTDTGAGGSCYVAGSELNAYTDDYGRAAFLVDLRRCDAGGSNHNKYDTYDDRISSIPVLSLDIAIATAALSIESNLLDNFRVDVPTGVGVGISFPSTFTARNKYDHVLYGYDSNAGTHNLVPLISGTQVQGLGSLGTNAFSFPAAAVSTGSYVIPSQTYNKIEAIQIKCVRTSDGKYGVSDNLDVTGPDHFNISIPTDSAAGAVFSATITAVDQYGSQLAGYSGTLSLTPVVWNDTATAASGQLSVTNVNIPSSGKVVINNQTYNKGGGIRIRAYDSALGVDGYSSSMTVTTPPLTIDHYAVTAPAQVTVGLPFAMQINARDITDAPVTYSLNRTINIQALLPPTMVAGSGSLGSSAATLVAGSTYVIVAAQTYNKIETIVLRATDDDSKTGDSANLSLTGPTFFDVGIPTAAQAGVNYQMTVVARDASSNTVTGYSGTVSLAAVQASNPGLSGAGTLGITSLNIAAGVGSTSFQTYTKAETIKLRVSDSGIGIVTVTTTNTAVAAGPPASLALAANPQSTVASVPTVLTAAVKDLYSNAVQGATVTFSLLAGSGTVAAVMGALPSAVVSTDAVTGSDGQAQAFFASTNSVSSQANLLRASIGGLAADTTVYNSVLITSAGGTIGSLANPAVTVVVPPNAYGASVRLSAQSQSELSAADVALATAAFARSPNTFVTTMTARFSAVLDSSPGTSPGNASQLVSLGLPFETDASSNVLVGSSLRAQSLLVPLSVLRIYRLNGATSLFEMVLDGVNLADVATRKVTAQVKDPNGLYVLGAPAFTPLSATSSGTVTTPLASGATAEVIVPFGAFAAATNLQLSVPSASGLPGLPGQKGWTGTNLAVSVNTTDNQQPIAPVTVNIGYKPADVAGLDVNLLRMVRYDAATGWTMLESTVDPVSRKVSGQTNHFSIFMVVAAAPGGDLSAGIVYPSPFRPAAGHTRIKFSRLPADAHVKVFSAAGRLLKELDADAAGDILAWDGNDLNGKALPSGVYIAVVKSGGSTRKLKFAVQR
jgi:outer membrane protein assembly factor BamB